MRSKDEIRAMRSGKGYFTLPRLADALEAEGVHTNARMLMLKEKGKVKYSAVEVKGLSKVLGISLEEAFDFFV